MRKIAKTKIQIYQKKIEKIFVFQPLFFSLIGILFKIIVLASRYHIFSES